MKNNPIYYIYKNFNNSPFMTVINQIDVGIYEYQ